FTLEVTEPPAAASGKKYDSVEGRCEACEIYGGSERPCISEKEIRRYEAKHGRPCPHVTLDIENGLASQLAFGMLDERTRPAVPLIALLEAGSHDDARRALARATAAIRSKAVNDALKLGTPEPTEPRKSGGGA